MSTKIPLEFLSADGRKLSELANNGLARDGLSRSELLALEAVAEDIHSRLAMLRDLLNEGERSAEHSDHNS